MPRENQRHLSYPRCSHAAIAAVLVLHIVFALPAMAITHGVPDGNGYPNVGSMRISAPMGSFNSGVHHTEPPWIPRPGRHPNTDDMSVIPRQIFRVPDHACHAGKLL